MKHLIFTLLLLSLSTFAYSQTNTQEKFFEKLYLRTFKTEQHVLKFTAEGVMMDGALLYTGTKILLVQGPSTTLTAAETSTNVLETFTVNIDAGTVTLKRAHLTLYDKTDYQGQGAAPLQLPRGGENNHPDGSQSQKQNQLNTSSIGDKNATLNDGELVITLDRPIQMVADTSTPTSQFAMTETNTEPVKDRKKETNNYTKALAQCQRNLRAMDKLISTYDTCGNVHLLASYDSIANLNQSLLEGIDKTAVNYSQRLQKSENDYVNYAARMQVKYDSIVNYIPSMMDAEGFTFMLDATDKEATVYRPLDPSQASFQVPPYIMYRIHKLKVTEIGSYAFENITQLTDIDLPSSILEIGDKAFAGCTHLANIQLPENLMIIGEEAFKNCTSIESVHLPASLTNIKQLAFTQCEKLKEVVADMHNAITLGPQAFDTTQDNHAVLVLQNGSFNKYISSNWTHYFPNMREQFSKSTASAYLLSEGNIFLMKQNGTADFMHSQSGKYPNEFSVPEKALDDKYTITGIGTNAFYDQEGLEYIKLPSTIETIGDSAFAFCQSLSHIQLPSSLKTIGEKAFFNCKNLSELKLPSGVNYIKPSAFAYCSSIDSLAFPNSITQIGNHVCQDCIRLKYLYLPGSVDVIGEYAFQNCEKLQMLTLREGTTTIHTGAFSGCKGLIVIDLPKSISSLGPNCFEGCGDIHTMYCHKENPPTCASNAFSPDVIEARLFVPNKADKVYEMMDYESKGFEKIKTLPDDDKLEKHKGKELEDGLKEVAKKPELRLKRAQKQAKQKEKEQKKEMGF